MGKLTPDHPRRERAGAGEWLNHNRALKPGKVRMMESHASAELPKYRCHKEVWALKIKAIVFDCIAAKEENRETDGSAMIIPEESGFAPFKVDHAYVHKHKPQVGGYFVEYKGGYKSFSPADAFESGYTLKD
jgi:hypothetical protein